MIEHQIQLFRNQKFPDYVLFIIIKLAIKNKSFKLDIRSTLITDKNTFLTKTCQSYIKGS